MPVKNKNESYQAIDEYFQKYRPEMRRTFHLMFERVTELGVPRDRSPDIANRMTFASEHLFIPPGTLSLAADRGELEPFAKVVYALSQTRTSFAVRFIDAYPKARFSLAKAGARFIDEVRSSFLRIEKPDDVLAFCLRSASTEQFIVFVSLFGSMAKHAPQSVPTFFEMFERARKSSSWKVIRDWIARGVDLISSGRIEDGIAFLLGLSRESRDLLGLRFAVLADKRNVLHIFCASFGGRVYGIHEYGISIFGLKRPYTDGASIFLPETIDLFGSIEANEAALTVLAAQQAMQVQNGSYAFDEAKISFGEELQRRYGTTLPLIVEEMERHYGGTARSVRERATGEVEAVFGNDRVLTLLETPHEVHFFRYPTPALIRELFSVAERVRIEACVARRYPGFADDFRAVNRAILQSLEEAPDVPESLSGEFEYLLRWIVRISLGAPAPRSQTSDRINKMFGEIENRYTSLRRESADVHDSALRSFELYNLLFDTYPVIPWCAEHDVRVIFDHRCISSLEPAVVADVTPELITGMSREREFVSEEEDPDEEEIDLTSLSQTEKKAHDLRHAILSGDIRIFSYPEYDLNRGVYVPKYCTLYESTLEAGDPNVYYGALETHQQIYKKLKRRFLILQPDSVSIQRKWLVGDEIHIGDATDYVTDLMRGEAPDDKIYVRKKRNDRSIAAAVLVDASSSTDEEINGVRIIDIERTALSLLASALSIVGDTFALYTFFSMGRRNVFVSSVKQFHESWTERCMSRIASIQANASNRDGCAIRHTTSQLLEQDEKTKLLILLSDGIPADAGYGSAASRETNSYAIEDTRRAINEARLQGVIPYCITIDRNARDYTRRLYGDYHYTILSDIERLPEKLASLYLKLTK